MILKLVLSSLLFIIYLRSANSNIFISGVSSSSSSLAKCTSVCENTFPLTSNKVARSECCSRGCRFYGIAELVTNRLPELNISRDACHNCCFESYCESNDQAACNMGCDTMAKHQKEVMIGFAAAEVSWSFFIEDGVGSQIVQAGEVMEPDDVLTDPALKRQLILDLMQDSRLPEMRVKTLPVNTDQADVVETEWWSDCSVRRVGVPRCLVASMLILLILIALWFGLSCDDKAALLSPPVLYDPLEQAPPLPPKYSLLDNDDVKV